MVIQTPPLLPVEDLFLEQFHVKIQSHLFDSKLTVKRMLRLVGMSRTDLHRKLNRAAGVSATEYLRRRRLQWAAKLLLEQPNWSIYQVALEVGFNSLSYFTKRFKEVFGCCPGTWREREERLEHL